MLCYYMSLGFASMSIRGVLDLNIDNQACVETKLAMYCYSSFITLLPSGMQLLKEEVVVPSN
jgi:hypothetical protein